MERELYLRHSLRRQICVVTSWFLNKLVTKAASLIILGVGFGNGMIKCFRVDPAFEVLVSPFKEEEEPL